MNQLYIPYTKPTQFDIVLPVAFEGTFILCISGLQVVYFNGIEGSYFSLHSIGDLQNKLPLLHFFFSPL